MPTDTAILLVESDDDQRTVLADLLHIHGFEVVTAATTDAGLDVLKARRFDVVLTEHRLPRKRGAAMLAEAESAGLLEDTEVLVLTTECLPELNAWRVLLKPAEAAELVRAVADAAQRAVLRRAAETAERDLLKRALARTTPGQRD